MYRFVKSFRKKFIVQIAQSFVRVFVQVAQMAKLGPQRASAAQQTIEGHGAYLNVWIK